MGFDLTVACALLGWYAYPRNWAKRATAGFSLERPGTMAGRLAPTMLPPEVISLSISFFHFPLDAAVEGILIKLQSITSFRGRPMSDNAVQTIAQVISRAQEMLPLVVARHFRGLYPYIGDYTKMSQEGLKQWAERNFDIIDAGILAVATDPDLQLGSTPDFSDRPLSLGRAVIEAADAFDAERTVQNLTKLERAAHFSNLRFRTGTIGKLFRKRASRTSKDDLAAIDRELFRLRQEAAGYYDQRA